MMEGSTTRYKADDKGETGMMKTTNIDIDKDRGVNKGDHKGADNQQRSRRAMTRTTAQQNRETDDGTGRPTDTGGVDNRVSNHSSKNANDGDNDEDYSIRRNNGLMDPQLWEREQNHQS